MPELKQNNVWLIKSIFECMSMKSCWRGDPAASLQYIVSLVQWWRRKGGSMVQEERWLNGSTPDCKSVVLGLNPAPPQHTANSVSPEVGATRDDTVPYCVLASEGRQRYSLTMEPGSPVSECLATLVNPAWSLITGYDRSSLLVISRRP